MRQTMHLFAKAKCCSAVSELHTKHVRVYKCYGHIHTKAPPTSADVFRENEPDRRALSSAISLSLFGFMRSFICILRVTI